MSPKDNCVTVAKGSSTLVRPRFSPGLLLRDDDLRVGVDYTRDLSRLLFRSLFGCGVVCGLIVDRRISCGKLIVTVESGVALTCEGEPIHLPQTETLTIDPCGGKKLKPKLWVTLALTQKCCAPRSAVCSCDDDDATSVTTREHAGYEIRIVETDPAGCACGCTEIPIPSTQGPDTSGGIVETSTPVPAPAVDAKTAAKAKAAAAAANADTSLAADMKTGPSARTSEGWGADPCSPCYADHYAGRCDCCGCHDDAVVLAVLTRTDTKGLENGEIGEWSVNHSVRRFVRPMLMRDPRVWCEQNGGKDPCAKPERT
ncbi:hypothetical protein [Rhizobium sp. WYJ-E13]|uniref:hypothetical protein n=1 Tax=Rhizobium sp. WYJ-E13 TaxID=2849093 RepID=UPI001C1EC8E4|nr:hypothetical protein [Rhizobium sp. WYJ-E13]QWW71204.1 hypothetical protein KQ933_31115 [Rhizobium sp. WYJ-E13]